MTAPFNSVVIIDSRDPVQRAAFYAVWRRTPADRAEIDRKAAYRAKCDRIVRERGVAALVAWTMTGVDPEASARSRAS